MAVETVRVAVRLTPAPDDTAAPKWTVGPWSLDDDGDLTPIAKDPSTGLWGFVPLFDGCNADNPEVVANMKLIAAAPSLYEALAALISPESLVADDKLQRIVSGTLHRTEGYGGLTNKSAARILRARTALALARGETK